MSRLVNKNTKLTFWLINGGHCIVPANKNKSMRKFKQSERQQLEQDWSNMLLCSGNSHFSTNLPKRIWLFFFLIVIISNHEGKKNWKSDIITAHMTPCPVFFWAVCVFYFLLSFYICLSLPTTPLPPRSTSSEPIWPELQSIWAGKRKYLEHFTVHRFIMDQIILPRRSFLGKWASVTPL